MMTPSTPRSNAGLTSKPPRLSISPLLSLRQPAENRHAAVADTMTKTTSCKRFNHLSWHSANRLALYGVTARTFAELRIRGGDDRRSVAGLDAGIAPPALFLKAFGTPLLAARRAGPKFDDGQDKTDDQKNENEYRDREKHRFTHRLPPVPPGWPT